MRLGQPFMPHSITSQLTGIVAISVVIGVVLTLTVLLVFFGGGASRNSPSTAAARIASITQLMRAAESEVEADVVLAAAQRAGIDVTQVKLNDLAPSRQSIMPTLAGLVAHQLQSGWGIEAIDSKLSVAGSTIYLVAKVNDRTALLFAEPWGGYVWRFVLGPSALALTIVLVFVLFLSIYAVRWIIAPLSAVAAAAQSFGRSPDDDALVPRSGPREIAQVADALNDMRSRIRVLLNDRTRMLAAISHDLRTPLTRLRLRAERVGDQGLKDGMLRDITRVSRMLDETLDYLRQDVRSEHISRVDLPSLLRTICTEFADVGHTVSYHGPDRLTGVCRPGALTRAVSNVVDNGVKHGSVVTVTLRAQSDGAAEIDVSDDGPGIPTPLCDKVFEPFFKVDDARSSTDGGFGLGLSIARDVVQSHGGQIGLLERQPSGLTVRITLPRADQTWIAQAPPNLSCRNIS